MLLTRTGCTFQGVNSLPLPGAVGRGPGAAIYHVEIANVGTLESNSPVMMADVVVGSVGQMRFKAWHADVEISVKPDVVVPANAVATVGQTSLLGSMHVELNPPLGQAAARAAAPGRHHPVGQVLDVIPPPSRPCRHCRVVINSGGLGQIGDIIHNFSAALSANEGQLRELLSPPRHNRRAPSISQRDKIVAPIERLEPLAATFAAQRDVVDRCAARDSARTGRADP